MTAGFDLKVSVYRQVEVVNTVGGADLTGTLVFSNVRAAFREQAPNTMLLQQGVEIKKTAQVMIDAPEVILIYEEDEIEITFPAYHPYYGTRWRVASVTHPQIPRQRSTGKFRQLSVQRIAYSRTMQE